MYINVVKMVKWGGGNDSQTFLFFVFVCLFVFFFVDYIQKVKDFFLKSA